MKRRYRRRLFNLFAFLLLAAVLYMIAVDKPPVVQQIALGGK